MDILPPPAAVPIAPALKKTPDVVTSAVSEAAVYHPLSSTLSVYLAWLLFWCGALYTIGGYQAMGKFPFELPLVTELITSPFVLVVSLGSFLFLGFSALHRWLKGGPLLGGALLLVGIVMVWLYGINVL